MYETQSTILVIGAISLLLMGVFLAFILGECKSFWFCSTITRLQLCQLAFVLGGQIAPAVLLGMLTESVIKGLVLFGFITISLWVIFAVCRHQYEDREEKIRSIRSYGWGGFI